MILKQFGFFLLCLIFVFSDGSFAKNPKQGVNDAVFCSANPGHTRCTNQLEVIGVKADKYLPPAARPVPTPPSPKMQYSRGGCDPTKNLCSPGSNAPSAVNLVSKTPANVAPSPAPKPATGTSSNTASKSGSKKNPSSSGSASATAKAPVVPPKLPAKSPTAKSGKPPEAAAAGRPGMLVNGKFPDSEVENFLDFCSENPGHETCGGAKVQPNPKVVTKVPAQTVTKEPAQVITKPPVTVTEGNNAGVVTRPTPKTIEKRPPVVQQDSEPEQIVQAPQSLAEPSNQVINPSLPASKQDQLAPSNQQDQSAASNQQQAEANLCSTNFDFIFPEGQNQYNQWQNAITNKGVQCNLVGTSPYRVCCQGDPGIDYNRVAEEQTEEKPQSSETAPQENAKKEETPEPLTAKQKEYCQNAEEDIYKCQNEFAPAERNCDPEDGSIGQWTRSMQTAADGLRAISQTSIQAACSGMVTMSGGMNAALTTFETMCQSSRESCISSCKKAKHSIEKCPESYKGYAALEQAISMLDENARQCQTYGSRVDSARQNANGVMQAIQNSQQCAAYTKAMNQPTICQRDPLAPGCGGLGAQNCDNPAFAASNTVCICLRSPRDPRCQSSASQGANGFGAVAGGGGVPNLPGLNGSMGENAGGGGAPGMDFSSLSPGGAGGAGAPGEDPGGKKGSGAALNPNGGGGNGGGSSGGNGGSGYERNSQQVYNGNWGSGGRGGGFALGGGSGRSGGGSSGYYRNPAGADFNQFRPQGKMNKFSPGLSGLTGPDGLTGPNSGTIWQKVRNRYQAKSYSLKQRP